MVEVSNVAALPAGASSSGAEAKTAASRLLNAKRVVLEMGAKHPTARCPSRTRVYTRLLEVSADEKHQKGLAALPYGVIVMDALDSTRRPSRSVDRDAR